MQGSNSITCNFLEPHLLIKILVIYHNPYREIFRGDGQEFLENAVSPRKCSSCIVVFGEQKFKNSINPCKQIRLNKTYNCIRHLTINDYSFPIRCGYFSDVILPWYNDNLLWNEPVLCRTFNFKPDYIYNKYKYADWESRNALQFDL